MKTEKKTMPLRSCSAGLAFTLIELLVVISIISILASMLMPVLSKAQEAGRTVVCKSNQRQLAVASMSYSVDNATWLNPLQTQLDPTQVETTYRVILWYYVAQMPNVYDCPTERNAVYADGISAYDASYGGFALSAGLDWSQTGIGIAGPYEASAGGDYEKWNQSGIGVAGAHWIHIDGNSDPTAQVASMPFGRPTPDYYEGLHKASEIGTASKLIWYGDGGCGAPANWGDDSWWIKNTDTQAAGGTEDLPAFNRLAQAQYGCQRHDGKANYAFADGHVQLLNANEIPCSLEECWWSINLKYHQTQQP
jgi:prepilin-type processing-associated H-X9-DG protein/prepilin-type N-terminal cleavage/methylation domain-containing protein